MIVYVPAIDWLTLSERIEPTRTSVLYSFVKRIGNPYRPASRMGYVGRNYEFSSIDAPYEKGAFFYGERDWKGTDWGLLVASGEHAHWLMMRIWETDLLQWFSLRCTRLDVQCSVEWPEYPFYLRHLLRTSDVKATTVHGLDGDNDWSETLYLGSRASPVMVRAYRKRIDDSGKDWLRVEVEYKRQASEELFKDILTDGRVANWFAPVLERCSSLYEMVEEYLKDEPDKPETRRIEGNTLKWLQTTVGNCVCRLLADDDQHEAMAELVAQWYNYSLSCQKRRIVLQ